MSAKHIRLVRLQYKFPNTCPLAEWLGTVLIRQIFTDNVGSIPTGATSIFTKAEILCGISGFLLILGMLFLGKSLALLLLWIGICGIIVATKLHESD